MGLGRQQVKYSSCIGQDVAPICASLPLVLHDASHDADNGSTLCDDSINIQLLDYSAAVPLAPCASEVRGRHACGPSVLRLVILAEPFEWTCGLPFE
jgi:hypothetical protein